MVTIILPLSRRSFLLHMFECLRRLETLNRTELLIIVDGDEKLVSDVNDLCLTLKIKSTKVAKFGDGSATSIDNRRYRIAEIHNFAKQFISDGCTEVFLIEDDTTFPPDTLTKMMKTMDIYGSGFVEGVELGRWNTPYIGAWLVDDIDNPTKVRSVEKMEGLQLIDAGGLYCCLVDAKLYREHHFEPYDQKGRNGLSSDFNFGLWMRRNGQKCVIDWSIQCGHYQDGKLLTLENTNPVVVEFTKTGDKWTAETVGV